MRVRMLLSVTKKTIVIERINQEHLDRRKKTT